MAQSKGKSGVVYRDPAGRLWYKVDGDKQPTEIKGNQKTAITKLATAKSKQLGSTYFVVHELDEEIEKILKGFITVFPNWGFWCVWGPRTSQVGHTPVRRTP